MTQPELLLQRLSTNVSKQSSKDAIAFIVPDRGGPIGHKVENKFTYQAVEEETSSLANHLIEKGLKKGDRALLVYPPSLDFMIAFLACLKAGVVAVPVFPPNPTRKDTLQMFSRIAESCGANHALTNVAYNHMKKISGIRDTFAKFTTSKQNNFPWPEQLEWIVTNNNINKSKLPSDIAMPEPSDLAFLQYTSGSTSEPKGVMITHGNLAHNLTIITNELKAVEDTVVVSWLPQYHDMGLIGSYLGVLYCGGSGWYLSPLSFLQRPMLWIEAVSKYQATHLQAPNFAFKLTARKFDSSNYSSGDGDVGTSKPTLDLSSVRHVINAAEPVDEDSIKSFKKAFGPFGFKDVIYPTYGLAEHTVFVCSGGKQIISVVKKELEINGKVIVQDNDDTANNASSEGNDDQSGLVSRLVGCGYPAHQKVIVKIVDPESLLEVDIGCVGEIWVQSPSKAKGYYLKEQDTKELFHASILGQENDDDEGYLRTGDLGFLYNDELFICGRLKDLIIVGGRNYYPQDIETTAEAASPELVRPGCSAAFTIDTTKGGGEEVALIMELREVPTKNKIEEICQALAEKIRASVNAEHSLALSHILLLRPKTVPKTTSGKIARAWCRKAFLGGTLDVVFSKTLKSNNANSYQNQPEEPIEVLSEEKTAEIRAMDKKDILDKILTEVTNMSGMPKESIDKEAAIVTMLDSMTISQFKGLLESGYAVKLSDEYLFRESTTLNKLVEVVKLGYAPDDNEENGQAGSAKPEGVAAVSSQGNAGGIAGALGCPPGVVCCVIQ